MRLTAAEARPDDAAVNRDRILAIANQKGGVGKTTTAINLGAALAASGREVLLIDLDPQGNASTGLGLEPRARKPSCHELIAGTAQLGEVAVASGTPRLALVPASEDMAGAEFEFSAREHREFLLRRALDGNCGEFDEVLIDCPPSLNLLTINALVAADAALVPLQCEFYALDGLTQLVRTIERVRRGLNPQLELKGLVLTMYDQRNNLCDDVAADVRGHFGAAVFETMIPRNVRIAEAPSHGQPVLYYDRGCAGAQAYLRLAAELLRRRGATLR